MPEEESAEGVKAHHKAHKHHAAHHAQAAKEKSGITALGKTVSGTVILFLVIGIGIVAGFALGYVALRQPGPQPSGLAAPTEDALKAKLVSYLNENFFASSGMEAEVKGMNSFNDVFYAFSFDITQDGDVVQTVSDVFASKDGKMMVVGTPTGNTLPAGQVFFLDVVVPKPEEQPVQPVAYPKSDKPTVELFVMSFCPYGVQAEQAMAPVVGLLGSKADIKVRFIASVTGDTLDSVQSLHGVIEGKEGARQLCIAKNYDTAAYWKYLAEINEKCYPIYGNGEAAYDACWKAAAATAKIDVTKIEGCMSSEGVSLITAEEAASSAYGVSGSPTLIINGVAYSGGRTPEGFKTAICSAFNEAPAECSQQLSDSGSAASGGCS